VYEPEEIYDSALANERSFAYRQDLVPAQ
jgi:hypothetical protein